jgi:hypothetical protein
MAKIAGDEVRANVDLPEGVSEKQADKNYLDTGNRLVRILREARIERERRAGS